MIPLPVQQETVNMSRATRALDNPGRRGYGRLLIASPGFHDRICTAQNQSHFPL